MKKQTLRKNTLNALVPVEQNLTLSKRSCHHLPLNIKKLLEWQQLSVQQRVCRVNKSK
jgi:hypothetical protein